MGAAIIAVTATLEADAETVALLAREAVESPGTRDLLLAGAVWLALVAGMHGIFALAVRVSQREDI